MNLKSEKLYIDETDHVEKRSERSEEARHMALAEQAEVSEKIQTLEAEKESNAMASLTEQQRLYGLLVLLAAVLVVADWPIQYGLNSVAFPKLWWVALVIISLLVVAGLGVVVEVAAFAAFFDAYRPRRTVRLCLTAAGVSGGLAAMAGTVLLFARTATGPVVDFLAQAVPVSMWVLGETLPITAGFLGASAWTLGYPKRRNDMIDRLKARLSELGRFLDWLDRDKGKTITRTVTMLILGVLLSAPAFSAGGTTPAAGPSAASPHALAGQPAVNAKARSVEPAESTGSIRPPDRCLIYLDMTASVDPEFRRQAVARLGETLPQFISTFQCSIIGIGNFGDEGPFAPLVEMKLAAAPEADDCTKATYQAEGLQKITQNVSGFQDYYQKRAETECRAGVEARFAVFRQKAEAAAAKIRAAMNPDQPPRGRCTAINSLISRAVVRANTVVLITDGYETCERGPQEMTLPQQERLIFILVPSRGLAGDIGRAALRVGDEWQRRIPRLQIVLPSDIAPHLWEEIWTNTR